MNAKLTRMARRMLVGLTFGLCVGVFGVADANAHTISYRPGYVVIHDHYARARIFPTWLRSNREFQHWYWRSRYRIARHLTWHRLYHIYLDDRRRAWHTRRQIARDYGGYRYRDAYRYSRKHRH